MKEILEKLSAKISENKDLLTKIGGALVGAAIGAGVVSVLSSMNEEDDYDVEEVEEDETEEDEETE